jgi:4-hydroxy-tetrahydrodipicolinate synthase
MLLPTAGILVALWTPTDAGGRVVEAGLEANLAFLRGHGIHGLMVLGSTGEFVRLSLATRLEFIELVHRHAADLPAMVNISDVQPAAVTTLGQRARALGFPSVAMMSPWFYPLAQADLAEFFIRQATAVGLPLFLYNFPERTGNRIALETVATVADRVPLAGIKQSGGEFSYHRDLVELGRQKRFSVFTGADGRLAEAMAMGAVGLVSGLANAVPELTVAVFNAVQAGEPAAVTAATARLAEVVKRVDTLEFPLNVAAAMKARGLFVGEPKSPVSAATQQRYDQLVGELRQLYREWNLI